MKKVLLLYIPVLHEGYIRLFKKYAKKVRSLYILGKEFTKEFTYLEEEIRAIDPRVIQMMVESLGLFTLVQMLSHDSLIELKGCHIITTQESLIEHLINTYFKSETVTYDTVFLRWDEKHVAVQKPVHYNRISRKKFDRDMTAVASKEGAKTSDWWREVGAVVVKNGEIILTTHNTHVPSEHSPYVHGDIRDFIPAGKHSDISSALHAEKCVITEAARRGIALEGASIYLSVFPCPDCAKVIAYSGIHKCYFSSGHASFDGEEILKANGVEIIFVKK